MPLPRCFVPLCDKSRFRPLDRLGRLADRFFDAERSHDRTCGEALAFIQHRLQTKFHGVDTERARHHVGLRIIGPDNLRHTKTAERTRGHFVRIHAVGIDPDVGDAIRPRRCVAGFVTDARADFRVGAGVPIDFAFTRRDRAVFDCRFDVGNDFVLGNCQKFFFACQSVTHRLFRDQRQHRHQRFELGVELGTVAAADVRHAHADPVHGNTESRRNLRSDIRRRLARGPDVKALMLVQIRQRHVRFHRHMLRRRRAKRVFEYSISFGKRLVDVAGAKLEVITYVRLLTGFNVGEIGESLRRPMLLMHQRRSCFCRFEHVVDCGQCLVIDLDELERVFRRAPIDRCHRHHGIADVADSFHGENRLIAKRRPEVRIDARHLCDLQRRSIQLPRHPALPLSISRCA